MAFWLNFRSINTENPFTDFSGVLFTNHPLHSVLKVNSFLFFRVSHFITLVFGWVTKGSSPDCCSSWYVLSHSLLVFYCANVSVCLNWFDEFSTSELYTQHFVGWCSAYIISTVNIGHCCCEISSRRSQCDSYRQDRNVFGPSCSATLTASWYVWVIVWPRMNSRG